MGGVEGVELNVGIEGRFFNGLDEVKELVKLRIAPNRLNADDPWSSGIGGGRERCGGNGRGRSRVGKGCFQ